MTIPSYAIPLYWLIQLTSVISLATLTPGYALKASGKGPIWRKCFSLVAIIGPVGPIYIHLGLLYLHLSINSIQPLWRKCFALVHTEPVPSHQCLRPPSLPFSALWATFRAHRPPPART